MEIVGLWSPREKVNARIYLCIEWRVYKCKLYNGKSISHTEQRVCIYDQYLLTQSVSQVQDSLKQDSRV